jgi:ProP effector
MAKAPAVENAQSTIAVLADLFPKCFAVFEQRRKPLKLGIHHDIMAALNGAITPRECANAMRRYCGNVGYLAACVEGALRIGLNGEAAGTVSSDEADNAKQRLEQQRARWKRHRQVAAKTSPKTKAPTKPEPCRLSLSDLRELAKARRATAA